LYFISALPGKAAPNKDRNLNVGPSAPTTLVLPRRPYNYNKATQPRSSVVTDAFVDRNSVNAMQNEAAECILAEEGLMSRRQAQEIRREGKIPVGHTRNMVLSLGKRPPLITDLDTVLAFKRLYAKGWAPFKPVVNAFRFTTSIMDEAIYQTTSNSVESGLIQNLYTTQEDKKEMLKLDPFATFTGKRNGYQFPPDTSIERTGFLATGLFLPDLTTGGGISTDSGQFVNFTYTLPQNILFDRNFDATTGDASQLLACMQYVGSLNSSHKILVNIADIKKVGNKQFVYKDAALTAVLDSSIINKAINRIGKIKNGLAPSDTTVVRNVLWEACKEDRLYGWNESQPVSDVLPGFRRNEAMLLRTDPANPFKASSLMTSPKTYTAFANRTDMVNPDFFGQSTPQSVRMQKIAAEKTLAYLCNNGQFPHFTKSSIA
jgi:hypothetical protein